jgi:hypothetical protein
MHLISRSLSDRKGCRYRIIRSKRQDRDKTEDIVYSCRPRAIEEGQGETRRDRRYIRLLAELHFSWYSNDFSDSIWIPASIHCRISTQANTR